MAVRIARNSRLRFASLAIVDDVEFFDLVALPDIPVQTGDINYVVTNGDRIDLLAYRFYGDPVLWWVIAAANGMQLLPCDLNPQAVIRVPSPSWVLSSLIAKAPTT
jgi:nucleoid-associated protein YgaU